MGLICSVDVGSSAPGYLYRSTLKDPHYLLEQVWLVWVSSVGTSLGQGDFGSVMESAKAWLMQPLSVFSLPLFLYLPVRMNPSWCVLLQAERRGGSLGQVISTVNVHSNPNS